MKTFLLAAGLGTRLRPLTDETPKCLLPIGGKPLLQIWLELMGKHGVSEVLVNTHWHAGKVLEFIKENEGERGWPAVRVFFEPELLGSGGNPLDQPGVG